MEILADSILNPRLDSEDIEEAKMIMELMQQEVGFSIIVPVDNFLSVFYFLS